MPPKLSVRNVWFAYANNQPVLRNVSFDVEEREIYVVAGLCGSGKSTLAKLAVGLLSPTHGTVQIDGVDLSALSRDELLDLRHDIGFLFQNSALLSNMTIFDNVALPARYHLNYTKERLDSLVEETLTRAGLGAYLTRFPSELSIGQTRRAAIARAMILNPKLILYDEPTAGLDPINSGGISDIIRDRYKEHETTSVIITHDMHFAFSIATKLAVMYRGKIIFTGTPAQMKQAADPFLQEFLAAFTKREVS